MLNIILSLNFIFLHLCFVLNHHIQCYFTVVWWPSLNHSFICQMYSGMLNTTHDVDQAHVCFAAVFIFYIIAVGPVMIPFVEPLKGFCCN